MDQFNVTLDRMYTFVRVAERGNLSAVARELGAGQSTVTRHLRELEEALGLPLLSRTTRRVALTAEGSRYYNQCVQILRLVEQSSSEIREQRSAAAGTVRVSCTAALGVLHLTRLIFAFQLSYPEIQIDLGLTDERIDLVTEGFDIALRLGPLSDSSMKLHHLGESERILVAAPAYLAARGRPDSPEELAHHNYIRMSNVANSGKLSMIGPDGATQTVSVKGDLRVDNGLAVREALSAGRGIAAAHLWLVSDLLEKRALEPLLEDHRLPGVSLNMLIKPDRAQVARVRLLIDYLVAEVAALPGMKRV